MTNGFSKLRLNWGNKRARGLARSGREEKLVESMDSWEAIIKLVPQRAEAIGGRGRTKEGQGLSGGKHTV